MRCNCCSAEVTQFNGQCPVCGFPMLTGGDIDIESFIRSYRENKLRDVKIYLKTYQYEAEGREIRLVQERYTEMCDALSLFDGEIHWSDITFEPVEVSAPVTLDFCVKKGEAQRAYSVSTAPTICPQQQAVGVKISDGFTVQFAVGVISGAFALSESVPLL